MNAQEWLDRGHIIIAPAIQWLLHQDDVMEDESFAVTPGVVRRWETALRAVLNLHGQDFTSRDDRSDVTVAVCVHCWELFPCPTVRAITDALDGAS